MLGVSIIELPNHADSRGCLVTLDIDEALPFDVKHVFFIHNVPKSAIRGEHASSANEALVAVLGSLEVDLDNGREQMTVHLSRPNQALCLNAGVYIRMRNFATGTILLVVASHPYATWVRFDRPQTHLLDMLPRVERP